MFQSCAADENRYALSNSFGFGATTGASSLRIYRLKVAVFMKLLSPSSRSVRDSQLRIGRERGAGFKRTTLSFEINEPDAYALEEALQLKEKHCGE